MEKNKNYILLKKLSKQLGMDLFGVADITDIRKEFFLPQELSQKFDKAISLGVRLSTGILAEIKNQPTRLYFHHYRTVNTLLDQAALRLTNFIQDEGFLALPLPASQILDWQKQTAHASHKKIAYLAGLGWIGRNNLLVTREFGSQLRLISILTNMPLTADKPLNGNCENCRRCIEVCPAQAIKENPLDFEHLKCFEKLKEFQKQRIAEQFICGVCVSACKHKT